MRGQNLDFLWKAFKGKYLTNKNAVATVLGIGNEKAAELLRNVEVIAIGKGTYYRTLDVIERIENSFNKN